MGKEKVIVDTNVLISALGWEGKPRQLLREVVDGKYALFISNKQLKEIKRVLDYPKFGFAKEQKNQFLKILFHAATIVDTKTELNIIKEDPSDNALIECAIEIGAKCIISGDKHLRKLKKYNDVAIVSVNEFLKRNKRII